MAQKMFPLKDLLAIGFIWNMIVSIGDLLNWFWRVGSGIGGQKWNILPFLRIKARKMVWKDIGDARTVEDGKIIVKECFWLVFGKMTCDLLPDLWPGHFDLQVNDLQVKMICRSKWSVGQKCTWWFDLQVNCTRDDLTCRSIVYVMIWPVGQLNTWWFDLQVKTGTWKLTCRSKSICMMNRQQVIEKHFFFQNSFLFFFCNRIEL